jgi:cytochrome c oxidase assembly protein subunit 15
VVLAGSVVRMTGSGMGCPDWPKCFGYLIPPTSENQVTWYPNQHYFKGQIIVHEASLQVAKEDHQSIETFESEKWEPYTKHNYAIFNIFHTWTEYINRLIGALSGIPALLLFFSSLFYLKKDFWISILAAFNLFLLGFEAWLGKVVVDGNLVPNQISIHMAGALAIVFLLIFIIYRLEKISITAAIQHEKKWMFAFLLILIYQLFIGTKLREAVDVLIKNNTERTDLLEMLPFVFVVHRSFSWLPLIVFAIVFYKQYQAKSIHLYSKIILLFLFFEILIGISIAYGNFQAWLQPPHLLLAFILTGFTFYYLLLIKQKNV